MNAVRMYDEENTAHVVLQCDLMNVLKMRNTDDTAHLILWCD